MRVGGWREIELTFDSRACDTVLPLDMCPEIAVQESESQRKGLEYEVANGETIDESERQCMLMKVGTTNPKRTTFQVADVHKPLLSISKVSDAGFACHLNGMGGYLLDVYTGDKVPIMRRCTLYVKRGWFKEDRSATCASPQ